MIRFLQPSIIELSTWRSLNMSSVYCASLESLRFVLPFDLRMSGDICLIAYSSAISSARAGRRQLHMDRYHGVGPYILVTSSGLAVIVALSPDLSLSA